MTYSQDIDGNSRNNQQIHAEGDVFAPYAVDGGVSIIGDNHGIVITSIPTPEEPEHTFDIVKKTRIPASTTFIGVISGLITITGFVTGGFSLKQIIDMILAGTAPTILSEGLPREFWWLVASIMTIGISFVGWSFFKFLRRNVLRLPKNWLLRAWAGIKEANGRTYPYSVRLAKSCPKCKNQKLRFQQIPEDGYDVVDLQTGARKKRVVTKWASMAVCPRNAEHSIPVDISGNDFDEPLPR